MEPLLFGDEQVGNASSIHWAGQTARRHLEQARLEIAGLTKRKPSEVIFTSGGTEADNLAILGASVGRSPKPAVVISKVEHPAVLAAAERLRSGGARVKAIGVDAQGRLDLSALRSALTHGADLVSVMAVNNETGIVFPSDEIIELAHGHSSLVHVDAVQAAGRTSLPLEADLITISGHKLGGPKGIGALLVREGVALRPASLGGPQERGQRAGTEPVASAVGLATALRIALDRQVEETKRLGALRDKIDHALSGIDDVRILGRDQPRVASTTTALFGGLEGDALLIALDLAGVAASSGSACSSGSLEPSHVLLAMGVAAEHALGAVRFSIGWKTTETEIDRVIELLPGIVTQARM
jgi:cysteine desulfurase